MTSNSRLSLSALVLFGCGPGSIYLGDKEPVDNDSGNSQGLDTGVPDDTGRPQDTARDTSGETDTSLPTDTGFDTAQDTSIETGVDTSVVDTAETGWKDTGPFDTGMVDTGDTGSCTSTVWYQDADGDGFGNVAVPTWECTEPAGYVSQAGDYDDTDSAIRWSPCQQALVDLYGETYSLWPGAWDDQELVVSLTVTSGYVTIYWEDATSPDGFYLVCGEVNSSGQGTVNVQEAAEYFGNSFTVDETGAWTGWNASSVITQATREDGMVFYYTEDSGGNAHLEP